MFKKIISSLFILTFLASCGVSKLTVKKQQSFSSDNFKLVMDTDGCQVTSITRENLRNKPINTFIQNLYAYNITTNTTYGYYSVMCDALNSLGNSKCSVSNYTTGNYKTYGGIGCPHKRYRFQ